MRNRIAALVVAAAFLPACAWAQAGTGIVDHTTQAQLLEKAKDLKSSAALSNGAASIKLAEYPNHYTMLSYRNRSGGGEIHEHYADIFVVLEGDATLLTGGKLVGAATTSPGELRGSAVEGGSTTELHTGDTVHIPAGVPHQLVIESGKDFVYYVIKVREN
jgi:mannose-6-phosphate isomerase-like protein (cupin superfamily)